MQAEHPYTKKKEKKKPCVYQSSDFGMMLPGREELRLIPSLVTYRAGHELCFWEVI